MLYMSIRQHIIVVTMQHSSQNLPIHLIFLVYFRIFLVHSEKLNHMKASLGLIERDCKGIQPLIVVLSGENRKIPAEDFNDEFGYIGCFSFLLFRLLYQQVQGFVERLHELLRIKYDLFSCRLLLPLRTLCRFLNFGLELIIMNGYSFHGLCHEQQYLLLPIYLHIDHLIIQALHFALNSVNSLYTTLYPYTLFIQYQHSIKNQSKQQSKIIDAFSKWRWEEQAILLFFIFLLQLVTRMSNYLQKYHLQKVQPVKNRTKQASQDLLKPRQKVQKCNAVKIPIKHRPPIHKPFFKNQDYHNSPQSPLISHKTQQLIHFHHQLPSQQNPKRQPKKHLQQKVSHRSHKSLNFQSGKDNSAGSKIITTIQGFFNKLMKSDQGCNCGDPCPYSVNFFQWADVPYQIVKDHYFKVQNRWQQTLKQEPKTLARTFSNQLSKKASKMADIYQQSRKNKIQINKDIDRTQSESSTFQNHVFKQRQQKILMSYAYEDKQVGYIQGMNMILSGLLYHIKEEIKTYAVFRKLIFTLRSIYLNSFSECYEHIQLIKICLKNHVNDLYIFLQSLAADLNIICLPWILSLLTCIIPLDYLHLIYQGFIVDKWQFFYRISLAIFIYHKERIMELDDAAEILLIFSPTNQDKHQYDWQDIIIFSKSIKL